MYIDIELAAGFTTGSTTSLCSQIAEVCNSKTSDFPCLPWQRWPIGLVQQQFKAPGLGPGAVLVIGYCSVLTPFMRYNKTNIRVLRLLLLCITFG